jgi:hypothetical protein
MEDADDSKKTKSASKKRKKDVETDAEAEKVSLATTLLELTPLICNYSPLRPPRQTPSSS